ncbi:MAG: hypothetical protein MR743_05300 [Oscillospiraceae bacterium]|nr:hypothetical protein [Oscillospiraceae bacterium]MCI7639781.1 hypothetical protein [Clostridiales bacterium]
MTKRILALALVLALACATAVTGFAADETTVTYTGTALEITGGTGAGDTPIMVMDQMLPGVISTGEMTLINESGALARIYMSTEVTKTLEGTYNSGYTVKMWVEGPDGTTALFGNDGTTSSDGVQVGGGSGNAANEELLAMNDMLRAADGGVTTQADDVPENYLLVANLANGESAVLKLSITPNGTATTNAYEAKDGNINFKFMAENVDIQNRTEVKTAKAADVVITQTRYWLNGVQTGDPVAIAPLAGVTALALVVFIVTSKKKKEREE